MVLDWYDAIHRGYGFGGSNNIQGDGVNTAMVQLLNPTTKSSKIPVTGFIRSVTFWCTVNAFVDYGFYTQTTLTGGPILGVNKLGADFPTTGNASSILQLRSQNFIPANFPFPGQFALTAGVPFSIPEWFGRIPPADPANGIAQTSFAAQFRGFPGGGILAVGQFGGMTCEWIELPSGVL